MARTGDTSGVRAGVALIAREGRIGRALLILMALGFAALVAAGVAAAWVTGQNQVHSNWVAHTYEVELAIGDARRLLEQAETTRRGYMLTPGYEGFRTASERADREYDATRRRLGALTRDNPVQTRYLASLDAQVGVVRAARRDALARVAAGEAASAVDTFRRETSLRRMLHVRELFDRMRDAERRLLVVRDAELQGSIQLFYTVLAVAGVLLLLVAFVTLLTVLRYTRDLANSRDILQQLNDSLEDIVEDRTADLSRANEEIQRFAYIVSHDLRSPLVNVMASPPNSTPRPARSAI